MRRLAVAAVVVLVIGVPVGTSAFAAGSADARARAKGPAAGLRSDFNGDGFADLAVGVPQDNVSSGAVNVVYGGAGGLTGPGRQVFSQNTPGVRGVPEGGDVFGAALATGDFDNDGFADLAIGNPGDTVGDLSSVGAVTVLYGGRGGLTGSGSQFFSQDSPGVGGPEPVFGWFGAALTAGDFDHDGFSDLAIGGPYAYVGGNSDAGAVDVLYGRASGLTGSGSQFFTQNSPGVGSAAEADDVFGFVLAAGDFDHDGYADLAVGARYEDIGSVGFAGAVNVLYGGATGLTGSGSQFFSQNTPGVGSSAERSDTFGSALTAADFDHDGFADLAVGVPNESVGGIRFAGAVDVLYGGATGLTGSGSQFFTQNSPGVGSAAEADDGFGGALTAADFDHDGFADLTVGAPYESIGAIRAAGAVNVLYGSRTGLTGSGSQFFSQNSPGVGSTAQAGDHFSGPGGLGIPTAGPLTAGDLDHDGFADLTVGVPWEAVGSNLGSGAVNVLYGGAAGLTGSGSQFFTQTSVGSGAGEAEYFGSALAATGP